MHLFLSFLFCPLFLAFGAVGPSTIEQKKAHPPHPEEGGLRLEIVAHLDDVLTYGEEEGITKWRSPGAYLHVDVAVRNISSNVITVPTTSFDGKVILPAWPGWGESLERVTLFIEPPKFLGKPTAFAATRFAPVTLDPGECALLLNHHVFIADRKHVAAIKEAFVHFGVSSKFSSINHWWHGHLEAYQNIERRHDIDADLTQRNAQLPPKPAESEKRKP